MQVVRWRSAGQRGCGASLHRVGCCRVTQEAASASGLRPEERPAERSANWQPSVTGGRAKLNPRPGSAAAKAQAKRAPISRPSRQPPSVPPPPVPGSTRAGSSPASSKPSSSQPKPRSRNARSWPRDPASAAMPPPARRSPKVHEGPGRRGWGVVPTGDYPEWMLKTPYQRVTTVQSLPLAPWRRVFADAAGL